MKKLAITAAVVVALLLVLDRGGSYAVSKVIAGKVKSQQHLDSTPSVVIHGFPFLTQVVGGSYDQVDLTADGVVTRNLRLDKVHIEAQGVQVALSDIVHGTVKQVPVRHGVGTIHLSFADLNDAIHDQVGPIPSISSSAAGHLTVTGSISAFGVSAKASGDAAISVTDDSLSILPEPDVFASLPSVVRGIATTALTVHLALPDLPFGIVLTHGAVGPDGVDLTAEVDGAVFPVSG